VYWLSIDRTGRWRDGQTSDCYTDAFAYYVASINKCLSVSIYLCSGTEPHSAGIGCTEQDSAGYWHSSESSPIRAESDSTNHILSESASSLPAETQQYSVCGKQVRGKVASAVRVTQTSPAAVTVTCNKLNSVYPPTARLICRFRKACQLCLGLDDRNNGLCVYEYSSRCTIDCIRLNIPP